MRGVPGLNLNGGEQLRLDCVERARGPPAILMRQRPRQRHWRGLPQAYRRQPGSRGPAERNGPERRSRDASAR
jgi:hypothetical protein